MIRTAVVRWDAVHIELDNGEKRFGYVVDIKNDGLVVDCGDGKPPQTFDCRNIRQPVDEPSLQNSKDGCSAYDYEVVLQLTVKDPWTWFPARILKAGHYNQCMFVEALTSPDKVTRYVVPNDHVRKPYSFGNYRECRGVSTLFEKRRIAIPKDFVLSDEFREKWMQKCPRSKLIDAKDGYLYCIRESYQGFRESYQRVRESYPRLPIAGRNSKSDERPLYDTYDVYGLVKSHRNAQLTNTTLSDYQMPDINDILPPEMICKILTFLPTEEQAKVRRVCARWNTWLHLPAFVNTVRIEIPQCSYDDWFRKMASGIYKIVAKDTHLVLDGSAAPWQWSYAFECIVGILDSLSEYIGITQIRSLTLSGCRLGLDFLAKFFPGEKKDERDYEYEFTRSFEWLRLDDVAIDITKDNFHQGDSPPSDSSFDVHVVSGRLNLRSPKCASELWNLLARCCFVDLGNTVVAFAGLKVAISPTPEGEFRLRSDGELILCTFEACDPRAPEAMRWKCRNVVQRGLSTVDAYCVNNTTSPVLLQFFRRNRPSETAKTNPPADSDSGNDFAV